MDKRALILGSGALAAAMIPLAMKAEAKDSTDWRDELLNSDNVDYYEFEIMREYDDITNRFIRVYRWKGKIGVQHTDVTYGTGNDRYARKETRFDDLTEHKTLEEAYAYAKELKARHYG